MSPNHGGGDCGHGDTIASRPASRAAGRKVGEKAAGIGGGTLWDSCLMVEAAAMRNPSLGEARIRPLTVRIPEACRITGIGRSKFYKLIQQGEIAVIKVGTMTLVPVAAIEAFLEAHASAK
jgi:excisionase family DNA binding protein